jgi:hypothetical protein
VRDQIEKIDFDIEQRHKRVDRAKHILERFDQALEKYYQMEYVTRALREREKQRVEREALQLEIAEADVVIDELTSKKFTLKKQLRIIDAEVGPIRYLAAVVYGDRADEFPDDSVRAIIIILIFVFDPLAVLLVVAGNMSIRYAREDRAALLAEQSAEAGDGPKDGRQPAVIDKPPDKARPSGEDEPASPAPQLVAAPEEAPQVEAPPVAKAVDPEPSLPPEGESVDEALENVFQDIFNEAGRPRGGPK